MISFSSALFLDVLYQDGGEVLGEAFSYKFCNHSLLLTLTCLVVVFLDCVDIDVHPLLENIAKSSLRKAFLIRKSLEKSKVEISTRAEIYRGNKTVEISPQCFVGGMGTEPECRL